MSDFDDFDDNNKTRQSSARPEHGARPPRPSSSRAPLSDDIPRRGYGRDSGRTAPRPTSENPASQSGRRAAPPREEPPPIYDSPSQRRGAPPPVREDVPPVYPSQSAPRYAPPPGSPPPPARGRRRERAPRDSGLYLPWWSLVILIVFVGVAAFGLLVLVSTLSGTTIGSQTPRVIVVTSDIQPNVNPNAQNAGGAPLVPPTATTPPPNLPTVGPTRTPLPGGCLLNSEVIIFNTGGVGLNLRNQPGGDVQFIAPEGDRMLVIDGPVEFDGITWCQVRSVRNSGTFGWGSLDFMLAADAVDNDSE